MYIANMRDKQKSIIQNKHNTLLKVLVMVIFFFWFNPLRPLNNLSVMRDGSSWVVPVLS